MSNTRPLVYAGIILLLVLSVGITSAGIPPTADFTANNTTVCINDLIQFNDTSINSPTEWYWMFGDGEESILQDPTHSYDTEGDFTVTLNATNIFGSDEEEKKSYITVLNCTDPLADFYANVTCSIGKPITIQFTGYCDYPDNKNHWDWGDGNTTDDLQSPEYTYNDYGVYTVNHTCRIPGGEIIFESKPDYIVVGVEGTVCEVDCSRSGTGSACGYLVGDMMWLVFGLVGGLVVLLFLSRR